MQIGFFFDQTRCIRCFTCCVACKDWHDIPAGPVNWLKVSCTESGIFPDLFVAHMVHPCFHCEYPPCVEACPVEAISKNDETGIVLVNSDSCLGKHDCGGMCNTACPYGTPQFDIEKNAKMQKCDMCFERWQQGKKPVCIEACPMRALDAGPLDEIKNKYGGKREAAGFSYLTDIKPAIIVKKKTA